MQGRDINATKFKRHGKGGETNTIGIYYPNDKKYIHIYKINRTSLKLHIA